MARRRADVRDLPDEVARVVGTQHRDVDVAIPETLHGRGDAYLR